MRRIFSIHILTLSFSFLLLFNACRKVDEHKKMVDSQPWLADQYPLSKYGVAEWHYPSAWVVGDTAMLIGKFFSNQPGSEIRVGGVPVKLVDHIEVDPNNQYNTHGIPLETMDVVRFVITKEMGIGPDRKITISANGVTIEGTPLTIRDFAASIGRTDTTLVVDKLLHWMPENANVLTQKGYAFVRSIHCDRNGTIWFDNQLSVNEVISGQVNSILSAGDKVTDDKGTVLTIQQILGSAISFDGNTLFFSMEDKEPSTDTVDNYIFRLCKMDVPSKRITTINRTMVFKNMASVNEDPAPFQGSIDRLKIVAMFLNTDLQDNLIYTNYYAPRNSYMDRSGWMSSISNGKLNNETGGYNVAFICRMDITGKVTPQIDGGYLDEDNVPSIPAQGVHMMTTFGWVDPRGRYLYGLANVDDYRTLIVKYDSQEEDIVASVKASAMAFNFHSYDTVPATHGEGLRSLSVLDWTGISRSFNVAMVISDGSVLAQMGASLYAYDLDQRTVYCYAGVENAWPSSPAPGQDKLTGKAKWVDFTGIGLIGQDKSNAVYFCRGAKTTDGVDFYKLYSPGK